MLIGDPDAITNVRLGAASGKVTLAPSSELAAVFCSTEVMFSNDTGYASFQEGAFDVLLKDTDNSPSQGPPPCS